MLSFWIDLESVPARISLGILTMLTITTQSSGHLRGMPAVSFTKAIDVWMATCLVFVFGSFIEYSVVNVLARREKTRRQAMATAAAGTSALVVPIPFHSVGDQMHAKEVIPMTSVPVGVADSVSIETQSPGRHYYGSPSRRHHDSSSDVSYSERPLLQSAQGTPCRQRHYNATCQAEAHWNGRDGGGQRAIVHRVKSAPAASAVQPQVISSELTDMDDGSFTCGGMHFRSQAQMVDVMSRILFPVMFLIFNIVYWPYYLLF